MAYLAELDMDEYGCLDGEEEVFPVASVEHDWDTPYPPLDRVVQFVWEPGEAKRKPDVFWYPHMRDWVCSERAYEVLKRCAGSDVHTIARGELDGKPVFVVQAPQVLDVVDRNASVIDVYPSYEVLRFPAFRRSMADAVSSRIFRVPGGITMVFVGDLLKHELEKAGIEGLRFVPVDWAES